MENFLHFNFADFSVECTDSMTLSRQAFSGLQAELRHLQQRQLTSFPYSALYQAGDIFFKEIRWFLRILHIT